MAYKIRRIPKTRRTSVTRDEYNDLVETLNERGEAIANIQKTLAVQFQRMAQMQAEIDELRAAQRSRSHGRGSAA